MFDLWPRLRWSAFAVAALLAAACQRPAEPAAPSAPPANASAASTDSADAARLRLERARALAREMLIIDGHVDVPYRLVASRDGDGSITEDVGQRTPEGDFDYPRAREGGLDAPFMSIYVPASYQKKGGARRLADELIDMVEGIAAAHPEKFTVAHTTDQVLAAKRAGRIALPLGIENGAAVEEELANVAHFHARGVRYITLTHSKDNAICDSSYDKSRTWKGLSPFGRKVVAEMNRVGIMVDISHVSDDTFYQVMEMTKTPVIASHSSCRHFTPGWERNMSDDMLRKLAENGGVIMINYGSTFISDESRLWDETRRTAIKQFAAGEPKPSDAEIEAFADRYDAEHPRVLATVEQVADHIDHVVKLVGVDYVGLGSDFDGVGDTLPTGLKDASQLPNLFAVLLERGYSEEDLVKIASANVLRVWRAVESHAAAAN